MSVINPFSFFTLGTQVKAAVEAKNKQTEQNKVYTKYILIGIAAIAVFFIVKKLAHR